MFKSNAFVLHLKIMELMGQRHLPSDRIIRQQNPPHLTTAPLTVRKKSRMEEEENGHSIRFQSIMLLLSPRLAVLYQLLILLL